MSSTEQLIEELKQLPEGELQKIYHVLALARRAAVKASEGSEVTRRIMGKGAGIWTTDAQAYIAALRQDDRQ